MVQVDGTTTVWALTVIESPAFAEIRPSISTFLVVGAGGVVLLGGVTFPLGAGVVGTVG